MNQRELYLPSDTFLQEYECFDMLYAARCVQGDFRLIGEAATQAVPQRKAERTDKAYQLSERRYSILPPCTERVA